MAIVRGKTQRFNVTFSEDLLEQLDNWANNVGVSRSAAVSVLVKQALVTYQFSESMGYAVEKDKSVDKDRL